MQVEGLKRNKCWWRRRYYLNKKTQGNFQLSMKKLEMKYTVD
ncbi:hypothetical protein FUSO7_05575 [Fusobacterium necrophorum BFTR-2]|nr:hypothetical protein FUSO7_05575 [Fusobacterium necrophorum BFTR-2]